MYYKFTKSYLLSTSLSRLLKYFEHVEPCLILKPDQVYEHAKYYIVVSQNESFKS